MIFSLRFNGDGFKIYINLSRFSIRFGGIEKINAMADKKSGGEKSVTADLIFF